MTVLTQTYCAFCNVIADAYTTLRDAITPKMNYRIYRELSSCTDRELQDMGICRGDIRQISMGKEIPRDGWRY
jgi:uncharacterized protein YjiS (DUF1127 family)